MAAFYFTAGFSHEKVTKIQSFSKAKKLSLRATRSAGRGVMSADHNINSDRPNLPAGDFLKPQRFSDNWPIG